MPNVDDIATATTAAAEQARELTARLTGIHGELGKLTAALAAAGVEGSTQLASGLTEDAETLTSDAAGFVESLRQIGARLEVLKGLLTSAGGRGGHTVQAPPIPPMVRAPEPRARVPAGKISEYGDQLPAHREGDPTVGFAIRPNGTAVKIQSSTGRAKQYREGLHLPNRSVVPQHAEGQATWRMRRDELDELSIVINKEPCSGMPFTCEETIRDHIRTDALLSVYVRNTEGTTEFYKTYIGTGAAVDEAYSWSLE